MSMDNPNEYEKAIEEYAEALRDEIAAYRAFLEAKHRHENCTNIKQIRWRKVRAYINQGTIEPGIYRLSGPNHAEGVVIGSEDYPILLPMFRK